MKKLLIAATCLITPIAPATARIGNEIPLGWVHTEHLSCSPTGYSSGPSLVCTLHPSQGYAEYIRDMPNGKPIRQLAAGQNDLLVLSQVPGWSFVAWGHGGGCQLQDNIISDCDTHAPECGAEPLHLSCDF